MVRFQCARVSSLTGPATAIPALLKRKSRWPWSLRDALDERRPRLRRRSRRERRRTPAPVVPPPSASAAAFAPASSMSARTTVAPRRASAPARALPIPEAAPVTMATCPWKWVSTGMASEPRRAIAAGLGLGLVVVGGPEPRGGLPYSDGHGWQTTGRCGPLALVGGGEWSDGCDFDAELLAASGGDEVLVLPTAAAYEHPEKAVATAEAWFAELGRPGPGPHGARAGRRRGRGQRGAGPGQPLRLPRRGVAHAPAVGVEGIAGVGGVARRVAPRGRGGGLVGRRHGAHRPHGRPAWWGVDRGARHGRGAGGDPAFRRRERREGPPVDRAWPPRGCPWWVSPSAPP